ncbi:hypothetical protein GCM10022600_05540 [Qipengyuania pelagi]
MDALHLMRVLRGGGHGERQGEDAGPGGKNMADHRKATPKLADEMSRRSPGRVKRARCDPSTPFVGTRAGFIEWCG